VLIDRYPREKFQFAAKLPAWAGEKTAEEARQMLFTSLERTGAGYFDFYLLHNINQERVKSFDNFDIWDFALEQREKGLIKHVGFSFHDTADLLDDLLIERPEMEFAASDKLRRLEQP
jgi:predicted aldo/keto reductase-like oxidoreductase